MPRAPLWLWAALSAGLPLALPFAARSLASGAGEGALATFNYAWKLVELPLVLAVQLVATLALPGITRALADAPQGGSQPAGEAARVVRQAFALAWALACAAAAALLVGAPAIVQLLFGWGRMGPQALAQVAAWGSVGAWGLLPQALTAVALTVLAALGRMRAAVAAYALALAALLLLGGLAKGQGPAQGAWLMAALDLVFAGVALAVLWALRTRWQAAGQNGHRVQGGGAGLQGVSLLPWRAMAAPTGCLLGWALAEQVGWLAAGQPPGLGAALALPAVAALLVLAVSGLASAELRAAMRR